jgi:RimJ/RimL family protein N-acetyltransferase
MRELIIEENAFAVREIEITDASHFLKMCCLIDEETDNMLLEPLERKTTIEEQQSIIKQFRDAPNHMIFVAEADGEMIGFLVAKGGQLRRNYHVASVVVGVIRRMWRKGVGLSLLDAAKQWAVLNGLHRLELTVRTENQPAISLYRQCGFVVEGERRHSLFVNGKYVDELYMALLI